MGLEVVPARTVKEEGEMSQDVKQVTDVARQIADVGVEARKISADLKASISEVREALGVAGEVSNALRSAGAELRGVLGLNTNNPPLDAGGAGDGTSGASGN